MISSTSSTSSTSAKSSSTPASSGAARVPAPRDTGSFLRRVLRADAATSVAAAALCTFGSEPVASLLGLPSQLLVLAGVALFLYAGFVAWLAQRPSVPRGGVWAAAAINAVWAVDCLAVAFGPWWAPSGWGQAFLVAQAVTVAVFAELQVVGLRRRAPRSAAA